jgi:hypothetical protein
MAMMQAGQPMIAFGGWRPPEIVVENCRRGVLKVQQASTVDFCKLLKTNGKCVGYLPEIHMLEGGGCNVSQVTCFQVFSFQWDTCGVLRLVEPC